MKHTTLNEGTYKRVLKHASGSVYFYVFPSTEKASLASESNLDLDTTLVFKSPVNSFLPPVVAPTTFQIYIPQKFAGVEIVQQLFQQVMQEVQEGMKQRMQQGMQQVQQGMQEIMGRSTDKAIAEVNRVAISGDEITINKYLLNELRSSLQDFTIIGEEKGTELEYYSRFHLSKEDFSFYHDSTFKSSGDLTATAVVPLPMEMEGVECLEAGTGESKISTEEKSQWQLVANMIKTSADMAYGAVKSGKLFKKIVVYGLLVDYTERVTKKVMKLQMDFVARRSFLHVSKHAESLTLEQSFLRVTEIMRQAVVRVSQ